MQFTLVIDKNTTQIFNELMLHYKVHTQAEVVAKAISMLRIAASIDDSHGELIARSGTRETKIIIS